MSSFQAGFGVSDITPRVGVGLYGFGPFLLRGAKAVRDPLDARAAAFELDGRRAVFVGCDLCTLQTSTIDIVRAIVRKTHPELTDADILIGCSHTHSGPSTVPEDQGWGVPDPVYMEILPYKIAQAVLDALDDLAPARTSVATVPCEGIGLNRVYDKDAPPLEDVMREDWRPALPERTDTQATVIAFHGDDGALRGFMVYFGCHPVVCCQATHYIHGDFPGVAIHNLMRQFPGAVGVFIQGAQGDVNSCVVHKPEAESMLALDVVAGRFERAIRRGLSEAKPVEVDVLRVAGRTVDFSTHPAFTREEIEKVIAENKAILHSPDADENKYETRMAKVFLMGADIMLSALERMPAGESPKVTAPLAALRLGPVEIFGAPFEVMQGIKNDVVAGARAPVPLLSSLVNGANGYAPDKERVKAQCYETRSVPFMLGRLPYARIHEELLENLLDMDAELFPRG